MRDCESKLEVGSWKSYRKIRQKEGSWLEVLIFLDFPGPPDGVLSCRESITHFSYWETIPKTMQKIIKKISLNLQGFQELFLHGCVTGKLKV